MAHPSDLASEVSEALAAAERVKSSEDPDTPEGEVRPLYAVSAEQHQARRVEALTLRLAGVSTEKIAERLSISEDGVRDMLDRSLTRAENTQVSAMRELENARLDRAQASIWSKVLEGDLKAVDTFLRISQRRARLNGLDAPTKIDLGVTVRQEMEHALAELERVILGEVIHVADARDESTAVGPD